MSIETRSLCVCLQDFRCAAKRDGLNRPAEGHMFGTIAVAPQRHMPAREYKLELVAPRLTKNGQRLILAKAADIPFQLPIPALQPVGVGHPLKNLANQMLLIRRVIIALDVGLGEARAAAKLHHTNIVPVFGVGSLGGVHYYAMQYIRGLGLDIVLEQLKASRTSGSETPQEMKAAIVPSAATDC